jgi:hypothetical protein
MQKWVFSKRELTLFGEKEEANGASNVPSFS